MSLTMIFLTTVYWKWFYICIYESESNCFTYLTAMSSFMPVDSVFSVAGLLKNSRRSSVILRLIVSVHSTSCVTFFA